MSLWWWNGFVVMECVCSNGMCFWWSNISLLIDYFLFLSTSISEYLLHIRSLLFPRYHPELSNDPTLSDSVSFQSKFKLIQKDIFSTHSALFTIFQKTKQHIHREISSNSSLYWFFDEKVILFNEILIMFFMKNHVKYEKTQ